MRLRDNARARRVPRMPMRLGSSRRGRAEPSSPREEGEAGGRQGGSRGRQRTGAASPAPHTGAHTGALLTGAHAQLPVRLLGAL